MLLEIAPKTRTIALLVNPGNYGTGRAINNTQGAARAKQVNLPILKAATPSEIDGAFASLGAPIVCYGVEKNLPQRSNNVAY